MLMALLCGLLTGVCQTVIAQDASSPKTTRAQDNSDWGLLGLIGLIGLLGLRKKDREED